MRTFVVVNISHRHMKSTSLQLTEIHCNCDNKILETDNDCDQVVHSFWVAPASIYTVIQSINNGRNGNVAREGHPSLIRLVKFGKIM